MAVLDIPEWSTRTPADRPELAGMVFRDPREVALAEKLAKSKETSIYAEDLWVAFRRT